MTLLYMHHIATTTFLFKIADTLTLTCQDCQYRKRLDLDSCLVQPLGYALPYNTPLRDRQKNRHTMTIVHKERKSAQRYKMLAFAQLRMEWITEIRSSIDHDLFS